MGIVHVHQGGRGDRDAGDQQRATESPPAGRVFGWATGCPVLLGPALVRYGREPTHGIHNHPR